MKPFPGIHRGVFWSIGWPGSASFDAFQGDPRMQGEVDLKWWNTWQVVNPKWFPLPVNSHEKWKVDHEWWRVSNEECDISVAICLPHGNKFIWVGSLLAIDFVVSVICCDGFCIPFILRQISSFWLTWPSHICLIYIHGLHMFASHLAWPFLYF